MSHTKKPLPSTLAILLFVFVFVFGAMFYPNSSSASLSSIIRAWVTINPLKVSVSAPREVKIDRSFVVRATVENKGSEEIEKVEGQIFLPEELELRKGEEKQEIEALPSRSKRAVVWFVKGKKAGYYIILVKASGELREDEITAEDSAVVKIKEERPKGWRGRFGFLQRVFDFFAK